jgi:hypothetical protein
MRVGVHVPRAWRITKGTTGDAAGGHQRDLCCTARCAASATPAVEYSQSSSTTGTLPRSPAPTQRTAYLLALSSEVRWLRAGNEYSRRSGRRRARRWGGCRRCLRIQASALNPSKPTNTRPRRQARHDSKLAVQGRRVAGRGGGAVPSNLKRGCRAREGRLRPFRAAGSIERRFWRQATRKRETKLRHAWLG